MNLKNTIAINGTVLLVVGALAFAARKRRRPSLFSRSTRPQSLPPDSLDPDSGEELEREVCAFLSQGRKIEAVKCVREYTNWGLKASKDFVDALETDSYASAVEAASANRTPQPAGITAEVQVQVSAYLQRGRTIQAIKCVRAATGWGLKEAKDYVDSLR